MYLYKKSYSLLVIDATFVSDKPSRFRKNLLVRILKLIMTIDDKIRGEKLVYDINSEAAKMSALSSGKIDKHEYYTGEEILPYNKRQVIEQAKSAYSPLGKSFEKQTKQIKDQGEKQKKAIEDNKKRLDNKQPGNNELLLLKEK